MNRAEKVTVVVLILGLVLWFGGKQINKSTQIAAPEQNKINTQPNFYWSDSPVSWNQITFNRPAQFAFTAKPNEPIYISWATTPNPAAFQGMIRAYSSLEQYMQINHEDTPQKSAFLTLTGDSVYETSSADAGGASKEYIVKLSDNIWVAINFSTDTSITYPEDPPREKELRIRQRAQMDLIDKLSVDLVRSVKLKD